MHAVRIGVNSIHRYYSYGNYIRNLSLELLVNVTYNIIWNSVVAFLSSAYQITILRGRVYGVAATSSGPAARFRNNLLTVEYTSVV